MRASPPMMMAINIRARIIVLPREDYTVRKVFVPSSSCDAFGEVSKLLYTIQDSSVADNKSKNSAASNESARAALLKEEF
jgi:hypothetical protein